MIIRGRLVYQGNPGYFELVAELKAKLAVVPSRDGALGVIGVSGMTSLMGRFFNF
jgi:hypothetical protein